MPMCISAPSAFDALDAECGFQLLHHNMRRQLGWHRPVFSQRREADMNSRACAKWKAWGIAVFVMAALVVCGSPLRASAMQLNAGESSHDTKCVFAQGSSVCDCEPNDSFETAMPIKVNQTVYGKYNYNPDVMGAPDFYKVVLPESGTVNITFANDAYFKGTFGCDFYLDVYNQYYEYLDYLYVQGITTRPVSKAVKLSKGVNYIKYYHNDWTTSPDEGHPYHFKLSYVVPGVKIAKLTSAKKKFKVKWAKRSDALKYEIRYSTKKSMARAKSVSALAKAKSKTIKAKSKKKYYVQMRVAKKIDGEVYWSSWSKKKAVKTK